MSKTIINGTENTLTAMGSLVTDEQRTTLDPREIAMGLVSDGGSDVDKPVTTWIFSFLTALGLLTFLSISFYRYHKRYKEKRDREVEYFRKVKELHPECDFYDFKVSRARTVMTNTHFNTFPNLDQLEFGVGPPIGRGTFRTFPPFTPRRSPYRQRTTIVNNSRKPHTNNTNPAVVSFGNQNNAGSISDNLNVPYIDDFVSEDDEVENDTTTVEINRPVSKKSGVKTYNKSKTKGKGNRKKKRNVLKPKAASQEEDFVEVTTFESPYLSDLLLYRRRKEFQSDPRLAMTRHIKSDSDIYAFTSEEFTPGEMTTFDLNDYYLEAGVAKPQEYLQKRRKSSIISTDSHKPNAFYDRLLLKDKPKQDYEELVHRDSGGYINSQARSLPNIEMEYHEYQLQNLNNQNRTMHTKEPEPVSVNSDPASVNSGSSSRRSSDPLLRNMGDIHPKQNKHGSVKTESKQNIPLREYKETTVTVEIEPNMDADKTQDHTTKL